VPHLSTRADIAARHDDAELGLIELTDGQLGLVSRQQLLQLGWSSARVAANTSGWRTVLPGVFLTRGTEVSSPVLARAAMLARPDGCLSHLAAARLRSWEVLHTQPAWPAPLLPSSKWPDPDRLDVTCRGQVNRPLPGLVLHRDPSVKPVLVGGVRMTDEVRTLVDVTRSVPLTMAVCLLDARLRQAPGLRLEVENALGNLIGTRGIVAAHRAMRLADERSESVLESLLRLLIAQAGLPAPTVQLPVRVGRLSYRADLGYPHPRLLLEADGRNYHSEWRAVADDLARQNALVAAGWRVLRFTWHQVLFEPEIVIATIRTALSAN
jgi:very-short-patch-repair endonuclease